MKKVKVGIIGCGGIANGKHMPSLASLKNVELVAFCDLVESKAIEACEKYGVEGAKYYTDYKELLQDQSIEVVHVCTPNRSHSFISVDALESGKHVMCEKPMAINSEEAKKMLDASIRTGKLLSIGYQGRCTTSALALKQIVENGDLGEIYYAKAHAVRRRAVPTWGVFLNEYEQGGGPLIDIGTHALDLTLFMMNNYKPKRVIGSVFRKLADNENAANEWGPWDPQKFTVEDSAFGYIIMENGATVTLESSWALNVRDYGESQTTLCGTKAGADTRDDRLRINGEENGRLYMKEVELKSSGGVAFYEGATNNPAQYEAAQWIDSVINNHKPKVLPEQAYVVTQILEAIYLSAKNGKEVQFENGEIVK